MLEVYASNPVIGLGIVLMLIVSIQRVALINSWKMRAAFAIAALVTIMQYAVRVTCNTVLLSILMVLMILYILLCSALFIWRDRDVPPMTARRRLVMLAAVVLLYVPAAVMNMDRLGTWMCRENWETTLSSASVERIPDDILGVKLHALGGPESMKHETMDRRIDGKWTEVMYLEDASPRKVGGELLTSISRTCTLKSLTPFTVIGETEPLPYSERELIFNKAQMVADGVYRDCGIKMRQVYRASIANSQCANVQLYCGHAGNLEAMVTFVRKGENVGVVRLMLRDVGVWCDNTTNSLIYQESAK